MTTSSAPLFPPSLLTSSTTTAAALPEGCTLRPLKRTDLSRGFLTCLADLTWIGSYSDTDFNERYDWLATKGEGWYYCVVIDDGTRVIGTATLIVERKFIHNRNMVGHVEEVAVLKSQQGKGLGRVVMQALTTLAKNLGVGKLELNCSEHNIPFYEKCGYEKAGQQMKLVFGDVNMD